MRHVTRMDDSGHTYEGVMPHANKSLLFTFSVLVVVMMSVMLQSDAVCYSVLQCVAVCCSVLQCGAVWCSVLQCGAVCCTHIMM